MELKISSTESEVLENLAAFFAEAAQKAIADHGRFSVALSGGSSPKKLHELLVSKYADKIDWDKVYFFFGDERDVPLDDAQSNYLMAKQTLLDPLGIDPEHVFPVQTALGADKAAQAYTESIATYFNGHSAAFDLIILGLGDNSHTASLFPYTPVLQEESAAVEALYIDEVKMNRITFTAPLINIAHNIAFLVYGKGKAEAVKHILEDERNIELYPAQLIKPTNNGKLLWFLDAAAASALSNK
ncbi:6-phosphogluconolactonase [Mucilaginibacter pallidiroseus]|uniref:6-phosphogluconolactonase n=1 Tax=Mucilaginibacter pallidiroseus TaxID=2599295 RepID=A0A563UGU5_9SPHI|nr:6-phosphogluconolactonase [Mucilaginibacter pallidiroseus]TWR30595.1 6-phosphogluconolactonase [Mucilaginibacter pallidiroseus]